MADFEAKAKEILRAIAERSALDCPIEGEDIIATALAEAVAAEKEACAVSAWSTGMQLHGKIFEAREVGSAAASAIRSRSP